MAIDTDDFKILTENYDINKESIVALGLFDGVHLGHKKVLDYAISHKDEKNVILFTFTTKNDRPKKKIAQKDIFDIYTKLHILSDYDIDSIYIPDFDAIKSLSAYEFVKTILFKKLNAKILCCGEDFKFGYKASANVQDLIEICSEFFIDVKVIDAKLCKDNKQISSTRIRQALSNGDIKLVNELLGYDYFIFSEIIYGRQLGRTIDCPTINQKFSANLVIPKYGVYISETEIGGKNYPSITNIGVKPTVDDDNTPLAETHIIGIDKNLYGKKVKVKLKKFIRAEQKFADINELSMRIKHDIQKSKTYFKID